MKFAIIDKDGLVLNVIEWDGDQESWTPPSAEHQLVKLGDQDLAEPGGSYDSKGTPTFSRARASPTTADRITELYDLLLQKNLIAKEDIPK